MKVKLTRKVLTILMSLMMVVSMMPSMALTAFAIDYVAQIGETKYETLADAVAAVQNNETIQMIADETINFSAPIILNKTKAVTLDLNGHTVKGIKQANSKDFIWVENGCTLTIKDSGTGGKLTSDAYDAATVYIEGEVILESGTVESTGSPDADLGGCVFDVRPNDYGNTQGYVYTTDTTSLTINGGVVRGNNSNTIRLANSAVETTRRNQKVKAIMNGGVIENAGDAFFIQLWTGIQCIGDLSVEINGGELKCKQPVRAFSTSWTTNKQEGQGSIDIAINGGKISMTEIGKTYWKGVAVQNIAGGGTVENVESFMNVAISGGYFTYNNTLADGLVAGKAVVDTPEGDVRTAGYIYMIGNAALRTVNVTDTETLQQALDNAQKGDTIVCAAGNYGIVYLRNNGTDSNRIMKNVTVKAADNAKVNITQFKYKTVSGKTLDIENLTIEGLNFSDPNHSGVQLDVNGKALRVNGLTVQNCSKIGDNRAASTEADGYDHAAFIDLTFSGDTAIDAPFAGDGNLICGYHNVKVLNNTVTKVYQPIKFPNSGPLYGLTVSGNTFTDCEHNHMMLSTKTTGAVVITDNTINGQFGRFARISGAAADAAFTITGNTVKNAKIFEDEYNTDIVKITGTTGFTVEDDNNTWTPGSFTDQANTTWIANATPIAKIVVNNKTYNFGTLKAAFDAAVAGNTIEVLAPTDEKIDITALSKSKNLMYYMNPEYSTEENASSRAATAGVVFVKDTENTFADTYSYECELRTYNSEGTTAQKLSTTKTIFYGDMETLADLYAKDNKNYETTPKVAGNQCWKTDGLIDLITNNITDGTRNYSIIMPNRNALNEQDTLVVEKDMILSTYSGTGGRIDFRLMGDEAFTLDLNGHEIYQVSGDNGNGIATTSDGACALRLSKFTNMTIKDSKSGGSVVGSLGAVDYYGDYDHGDGGMLTLESGTLIGRMVPALSKSNDDNSTDSFQNKNEKGSIIRIDDNGTFIMNGGTLDIDRHEYTRIGETKLWKTAAAIQVTHECKNATITLNGGSIERMLEDQQAPTNLETDYPEIIYRDNNATVTKTVSENINIYPKYVAQIGTTEYTSLADAIAAVPTNGIQTTIQMIADETCADNAKMTIAATQNIVLDLNGKTVTGKNLNVSTWAFLTNNGTLEITDTSDGRDGKITSSTTPETDGFTGHYTILNKNTMTLTDGIIEETSEKVGGGSNLKWALRNEASANQTVSLTINGGTVIGEYNAVSNYVYDNSSTCNFTVTGGSIITTGRFSPVTVQIASSTKPRANVSIRGGEFIVQNIRNTNANGNAIIYCDDQAGKVTDCSNLNFSVTGGKFNTYNTKMLIQFDDFKAETVKPSGYVSGGIFKVEIDDIEIVANKTCVANTDRATRIPYPWTVDTEEVVVEPITESDLIPSGATEAQTTEIRKALNDISNNSSAKDIDTTNVNSSVDAGKFEINKTVFIVKKPNEETLHTINIKENDTLVTVAEKVIDSVYSQSETNLDEGDITKRLNIRLDAVTTQTQVEQSGSTTTQGITYNVKPIATIYAMGKDPVEMIIPNELIKTPIVFHLPLDTRFEAEGVKSAIVIHHKKDASGNVNPVTLGSYPILGKSGSKYVEVASTEFSDFDVLISQQELTGVAFNSTTRESYNTLEAAVAAATDGDTITLLKDATGNGIVIPKSKFPSGLTIDLNNHCYSIEGTLVGSSGTKTNGFQILDGNKVTIKNGIIESNSNVSGQTSEGSVDECRILIQNYSNLTLTNVTLDGTRLKDSRENRVPYTLSNNSGEVVLQGSTITAASGGIAFDTCKYGTYEAPSVEVVNTTIEGDVELAGGSLDLESGTLKGELLDGGITTNVERTDTIEEIKRADGFNAEPPEGYEWQNVESIIRLVPVTVVAEIVVPGTDSVAEQIIKQFTTAKAALAEVGTKQYVRMIADSNESTTNFVLENQKLDLNGHNLQVATMLVLNGTIIDSTDNRGGSLRIDNRVNFRISNPTTNSNGNYIPVWLDDTKQASETEETGTAGAKPGYKFVKLKSFARATNYNLTGGSRYVRLYFQPNLEFPNDWTIVKKAYYQNDFTPELDFCIPFTYVYGGQDKGPITFTFNGETIKAYVTSRAAGKNNGLYLQVNGSDKLESVQGYLVMHGRNFEKSSNYASASTVPVN